MSVLYELPRRDPEVVVIGAGPAGLVAAITLARLGVRCLVIDRHEQPLPLPRATLASLATMELIRSWGLEPQVRALSDDVEFLMSVSPTLTDRSGLERVTVGVPTREQAAAISPTIAACIAQDHLERILADHLATLPAATLLRGADARLVEHDGPGVRVEVRDRATGVLRIVEAAYLVAADGAHSATRRALDIPTQSSGPLEQAILAVFTAPLGALLGDDRFLLHATSQGIPGTFLPAGPHDRWLYGFRWDPEREHPSDYPPERIARMIRAAAGVPDLDIRIGRSGAFAFEAEIADRFRDGSVFLVGDAAHRVTPRGGTGMNAAIAAAHNLAWKLAWVSRGWAGDPLLDSYELERRPIAEANLARSIDPMGSRRDLADVLHLDLVGRIPHLWHSQPDGSRQSTLDLLGEGTTLFTGPSGDTWRRAAGMVHWRAPLTLRALDASTSIGLGIGPHGALLVRPDGIPLWTSRHDMNARDQLSSTLAHIDGDDPARRIDSSTAAVVATGT